MYVELYATIGLRTVISYLIILIIFRLMGKREIGELSILDLVVFIMLGDIAVIAAERQEKPFLEILFPMLILLVIQLLFSYMSLKSSKFRKVLDGSPSIIINNGKIDEKAMRQQRYNFDDLLTQLREKGIIDINEVQFAILETTGKLSVIQRDNKAVSQHKETAFPLIMDGEVQEDSLKHIGQNQFWLRHQLKKRGYEDIKKISLCSYKNGTLYIDQSDS
ncbi:DUF421 domain-containing protein [Bacillus sp. JJ634]